MENAFRPDKKYFSKVLWVQFTISVVLIILMSVIHFIVTLANGKLEVVFAFWIAVILGLILMWIFSTLIASLWIKNLEYIVEEDRVKIKKGILTKTQKNIPFRAITDFAQERTLYDRFLGIGSIKIQTAGQSHQPSGYEGKLAGLTEYEKWHSELRDRVRSLHPRSETITTLESAPKTDTTILEQILAELKVIKKNTTQ